MGEPGTKEVLHLEDLEVSGGGRTGRKHVLSILAENKPGVLARIAALFSRRLALTRTEAAAEQRFPWEPVPQD